MKRIALWLTLLTALLLITGCGGGIADDSRSRQDRWKRVFESDAKQFNDDLDAFLLTDQPGRLTRWHTE